MNLRELLQYELWSKRTHRKILVWFGIVLGSLVVVVGIWLAIEWFWLTSGERRTGREALVQIDALQNLEPATGNDFDLAAQKAEGSVQVATNAAWTLKDKRVCAALGAYLVISEMKRDDERMQRLMQERHVSQSDSSLLWDEKMKMQEIETRRLIRLTLHRVLD